MRTSTVKMMVATAGLGLISATQVFALVPTYSYGTTSPGGGMYNFADSGGQLTDGVAGTQRWWSADLADPWQGWRGSGQITFDFGTDVLLEEIEIGSLNDPVNKILFPAVTLEYRTSSGSWVTGPTRGLFPQTYSFMTTTLSSAPPSTYGTLEFEDLEITAQYFRLSFTQRPDVWTLFDEVEVEANRVASRVPDAGSTAALLGLAMLGMGFYSRKTNKA